MTLHIPSWIVYTAFYCTAGSVFLILVCFALVTFHKRTVSYLKSARYYWFAKLMMWSKYHRDKNENNIWDIIDIHAEELRQENPERFRQINSRLNFSTNMDKGARITKAVEAYLADPEHQKRSDMESVIIQVLEAA